MNNNIRTEVFIFIGLISVVLSIVCFVYGDLKFEQRSMYGGDAFTGIQNAAAVTSENVMILAKIVKIGFGSVLLVAGLGFLGFGLTEPMKKEADEDIEGTGINAPSDQKVIEDDIAEE